MAGSLLDQLQQARHELLDLSARNRLLNTPLGRGRSTRLDVVGERSTDVFRWLVRERREMTFGATTDETKTAHADRVSDEGESLDDSTDDDESSALPQPDEGSAVNEAKFKVKAVEEDLAANLSLQEKLKLEFRLKLPDVPAPASASRSAEEDGEAAPRGNAQAGRRHSEPGVTRLADIEQRAAT